MKHTEAPVSLEQYAFPGSLQYPLWVIPRTLGILGIQTALMQLILGSRPDGQRLWRVIIAVVYTGAVMVLFALQLMGDPSPGAVYMPVTPIYYAILLFLLSTVVLFLTLARLARRSLTT
jgi:NADH:ubiquinone oxidoreductase subunit 6 (subunit J)